jgi:trimethylamine--corrinoid protein Co-methyltransferase
VSEAFREGIVVKPYERLNQEQIEALDAASLRILSEPGIWCHNQRAAELLGSHGAKVTETKEGISTVWRVSLPEGLIKEAVAQAPSSIVLGARDQNNRLLLDSQVPRVYFGSGSEANVFLDAGLEEYASLKDPEDKVRLLRYKKLRGSTGLLARAARLCQQLDNLDFFIRPLNIQDEGIDENNHDVNKFFASLNNITKHVQAGLTSLDKLPDIIKMAEIIAGGPEALKENPIISFIACVFKSPLQMVADTADKVFALVEAGLPVVISSSPQGGSSAPIQEAGMVAQINAEILAGVAFTQLIRPGAPVLYGSVPVRARLDDLHDLYGCPEFNWYNMDCVQMARHYRVPSYSSAGVGDAGVPGVQSTFEKLLTQLYMAMSGAQYIHYAFGLLDRTNTFCPVSAVLDDEMIGKVKHSLRQPKLNQADIEDSLKIVDKVMASTHRLFARHARKAMHAGDVADPFRFQAKGMNDGALEMAWERANQLEGIPAETLPEAVIEEIFANVPGILPELRG